MVINALGGQRHGFHLELELQAAVCELPSMGEGSWTWVFCKCSIHF